MILRGVLIISLLVTIGSSVAPVQIVSSADKGLSLLFNRQRRSASLVIGGLGEVREIRSARFR